MPGDINTPGQPRVFISYARTDGEDYTQSLRRRLEKEQIPLWQDRVSLEGGRDWWLQIEEALDHVEFMVIVMTPAALQSPIVTLLSGTYLVHHLRYNKQHLRGSR